MSGALCLALAFVLSAGTAQEEGRKLEQIRVELDERRAAIRDLDNQQRSLLDSLGELDESLASLDDAARAAGQRLATLQAELLTLEASTKREEQALAAARKRLSARLRVLYVGGAGGAVRALLGAEGFEELALRRRFLQTLAESDAALVQEVARGVARVSAQRDRLRQAAAEASFTAEQIEQQRALMALTRAEREAAIARIGNERELAERRADELQQKRIELSAFLRKLVSEANRRPLQAPTRISGVLRAGLAWPVEGVVIRKFGVVVDKDSRAEIVSNGLELRAPLGAPIAAVADGRVVHVGWMRGFGRVVIVDHGGGHHSISAHIQRPNVSRGDEVARGQTIAFVGDTESENGAKLYFELREQGRPRDPLPFLRRSR